MLRNFKERYVMPRSQLQASEIVCLEHQGVCLYAELIQVLPARQRCWVRPLLLSVSTSSADVDPHEPSVYDLRTGADLLWPLGFFRPVVDLEVIPLLTQLSPDQPLPDADPSVPSERVREAQQRLRQLMQSLWQADPGAF